MICVTVGWIDEQGAVKITLDREECGDPNDVARACDHIKDALAQAEPGDVLDVTLQVLA